MMTISLKKVPDITILFWGIKILTTAMGESISDYLVGVVNPVYAVIAGAIGLAIALYIQFTAEEYTPWKYWLAVSMVAVFGTMAADVLHIVIGVPYTASVTVFALILACIFVLWYRTEKTLSIHSITAPRKEWFYWLTVGATFALGTATGDLTAYTLHLGYLISGVMFTLLILIPLLAHYKLRLNAVIAFWIAYILTRPLGASFADWFGKSSEFGGIGIGSGVVGTVLIVLIIVFVSYSARTRPELRR